MKILLFGATGFIGKHLSNALNGYHEVCCVIRKKNNNQNQFSDTVIVDLSTDNFEKRLPKDIDCVIYLAQSSEYRNFPTGADNMVGININATAKVLEWARVNKVQHFILTSTANVYGNSEEIFKEEQNPKPNSFYGASKLAAEFLAAQYHDYFKVDILRCFTVYGPNQQQMLIPSIIEKITQGKVITLAAGVGVYLSPIHVSDVVEIIRRIILEPCSSYRIMNVCGSQIISLREIINVIENNINKLAVIEETSEEARYFVGCNQKLRNFLGPSYRFVDIEQGLQTIL